MFGDRAKIGYINPAVFEVVTHDFYRIVPEGVGMIGLSLAIQGWDDAESGRGLEMVEQAAKELARRKAQFIVHLGGPLVVGQGKGYDRVVIERIQQAAAVPATTTIRAVMDALSFLGLKRLVIVDPYPDTLNRKLTGFLTDNGYETLDLFSFRGDFWNLKDIPIEDVYRASADLLRRHPEADGLYVPCSNFPIADAIQRLEDEFRKPVVANMTSHIWAALSALRIKEPIRGWGRLLASLAEP